MDIGRSLRRTFLFDTIGFSRMDYCTPLELIELNAYFG